MTLLNEIKVVILRSSLILQNLQTFPRALSQHAAPYVVRLSAHPCVLTRLEPCTGYVGVLPPEHRHLLLRLHGAAPGALTSFPCTMPHGIIWPCSVFGCSLSGLMPIGQQYRLMCHRASKYQHFSCGATGPASR